MGYKKQINVKLNLWDTDVKKLEEIAKEYDVTFDELVTEVILSYKALKKEYREVLSKKQLIDKLKENAGWNYDDNTFYYNMSDLENFILDIFGFYEEENYIIQRSKCDRNSLEIKFKEDK